MQQKIVVLFVSVCWFGLGAGYAPASTLTVTQSATCQLLYPGASTTITSAGETCNIPLTTFGNISANAMTDSTYSFAGNALTANSNTESDVYPSGTSLVFTINSSQQTTFSLVQLPDDFVVNYKLTAGGTGMATSTLRINAVKGLNASISGGGFCEFHFCSTAGTVAVHNAGSPFGVSIFASVTANSGGGQDSVWSGSGVSMTFFASDGITPLNLGPLANDPVATPEPSTLVCLLAGALFLLANRYTAT